MNPMIEKNSIMVVDDDPAHRTMLRALLGGWGYNIFEADDGSSAIEEVKNRYFDLILMDVQMPELDGLNATVRIRDREKGEEGGHIPIVAMTAHAMKGDRERCLAAGMDDYVSKPIKASELFAVIERVA